MLGTTVGHRQIRTQCGGCPLPGDSCRAGTRQVAQALHACRDSMCANGYEGRPLRSPCRYVKRDEGSYAWELLERTVPVCPGGLTADRIQYHGTHGDMHSASTRR